MPRAPKDDTGKPDMSLIPLDLIMEYDVPAYVEGLVKYDRESWRRGFPVTKCVAAILRHLTSFETGEDWDPDALERFGIKKHHLAGCNFYLKALMHTLKYHPELDDRRDPATGELLKKGKKHDD